MKNTVCVLIIILLIPALGSAQTNRTFADPDYWIPADFNPGTSTLLIARYPLTAKAENKMEEFLSKEYPWPYEIVDESAIRDNSAKYSDTTKYKFGFLWTLKNWYGGRYDVDPNGFFYERTIHKEYPTTRKINNYGQKSYMPFFNTIVKHFQRK